MIRRFILFGFGIFLGVFFLSFGPNNRLKQNLKDYINYFDMSSRVIYHLNKGENIELSDTAICQLNSYSLEMNDLLADISDANVNFNLSNTSSINCKMYIVEKVIKNKMMQMKFLLCDSDTKVVLESLKFENEKSNCFN